MRTKQRVLVLADRTAEAPELIAALRDRAAEPASFTLLVPATADGLARDDSAAAWSRAISRAELAAARIREAGLELAEVIVGDSDPALALDDAVHARRFDDVLLVRPAWEVDPEPAPLLAAAAA